MKIVIAIDSLRGSLTSLEAGEAIKEGILKVKKDATVVIKPLADGGEGTTEALTKGLDGEIIKVDVVGPIGKMVTAEYGYIAKTRTSIMEMAAASGIILVSDDEKNPMIATTFGVGQMIKDAISKGVRDFIIGIGGSATNDGGVGMLQSLGYEFYDKDGNLLGNGAEILDNIAVIKDENVIPELNSCRFKIACDVNNPLCGENGATYVYGAQKGVTLDIKDKLDKAMLNYAEVATNFTGKDFKDYAGAGAAGGLGFAFKTFFNAQLVPGIELILDAIQLEEELKTADIVITGEGMLDFQTAMGKAPIGVARLAKKYGVKVIAFAGGVTREASLCNENGIDAYFPIVRGVTTLDDAMKMENAYNNMKDTVEQVFRLL